MPKFTNSHNLPDPLYRSLTWETYTKGQADISVTELLKSPRQRLLSKRHDSEIKVDASENMWVLLGRAVHSILHNESKRPNSPTIAEERLYAKVKGPKKTWTVSGEFDLLYEDKGSLVLADYKVLSVWSYIFEKSNGGVKKDHEQQLNIYRWLLALNGFYVPKVEIAMIFRDWKNSEAMKSVASGKTDYPQCPVVVIKAMAWDLDDIQNLVERRVAIHQEAETMEDDDLPECTPDERWRRGDSWAVYEGRNKKAFRVFDNENEAANCAEAIKGRVEFRAGKSSRCELYCYGRNFCNQYQKEVGQLHTFRQDNGQD